MDVTYGKGSDTRKFLSFQKFERTTCIPLVSNLYMWDDIAGYLRSTTSRDVAKLVLNTILGSNSGGITTSDDDNLAILGSLNGSVQTI